MTYFNLKSLMENCHHTDVNLQEIENRNMRCNSSFPCSIFYLDFRGKSERLFPSQYSQYWCQSIESMNNALHFIFHLEERLENEFFFYHADI